MIEAVVFDYGGVISSPLFRGLGAWEAAHGYPPGSVAELLFGEAAVVGAEGRGGDPIDGAAGPRADPVTHDWHRLEVGELSLHDYVLGVVARAPRVLGRPLDVDEYQRFMHDLPVGVHWPVVHRARELKTGGLKLGLLTNNVREFGDSWRATFPVDELFAVVVDSSAVGMRKPDPRVYGLACERLAVEPAAVVFVDDNRDNVEAARALGMEVVHFGPDPWTSLAELDAVLDRRGTRPVTRR